MNNHILHNKQQDAALRSALARRAGRCPQMPVYLNEQLMTRSEVRSQRTSCSIFWPWAAVAACIVVAVFFGYTYTGDKLTENQIAVLQTETYTEKSNIVYASTGNKEQSGYQSPSLVDEFIVKLAGHYGIEQEMLDSTSTVNAANYLYVFPDEMDVNIFGRLLQVACWYNNNSPGYQLRLSQEEFFFELDDMHEGRHHMWLAEKIGNNTFLYGVNAPIGVSISNTNYMNFRDKHAPFNKKYMYYKL